MNERLAEMVLEKYPDAQFVDIDKLTDLEFYKFEKLCYVAETDGFGIVSHFCVAYVLNDNGVYWTEQVQPHL